jgi:hypothetical protein
MNAIPGRSCLVTDLDDLYVAPPMSRAQRRQPVVTTGSADPGDDAVRHARAAAHTPAEYCSVCGHILPTGFARRSKSGKVFCLTCAARAVAEYYRRHPEARPARIACDRTGTAYMAERERYEVRYHAGHARWQIADTQTHHWLAKTSTTEAEARATAQAMNDAWRAQLEHEREFFGSRAVPSTAPWHTSRVGERSYGIDPA